MEVFQGLDLLIVILLFVERFQGLDLLIVILLFVERFLKIHEFQPYLAIRGLSKKLLEGDFDRHKIII